MAVIMCLVAYLHIMAWRHEILLPMDVEVEHVLMTVVPFARPS